MGLVPMSETQKLTISKSSIVKEVAEDLGIKEELVHRILERFIDIMIEYIVNDPHEFDIKNVVSFSVTQTNVKDLKSGEIVPTLRISAKLAKTVRNLFHFQHGEMEDHPYFVNRDNWRSAIKWVRNRSNFEQ